jgi:tRNA threonylcarbamoyl adenosine modification protein (Sua5/YciO/YrdC/YwlC family)
MAEAVPIVGPIEDPRSAELAYDVLARCGVAVLPTDTLPGLSARLSAEDAFLRIGAIMRAPNDRRYILLASSLEMVDGLVSSYGCGSRAMLMAAWPAPLSVIVPAGPACPAWVGPTVAVRVPSLRALCALIEKLGEPIVSTSVNRTGSAPLTDAHEIRREIGTEVDLIMAGSEGGTAASTLVDLSGKTPRLVRRGSYAWAAAGAGKPSK